MEATARKTRGAELSFWARLSVVAFLALVAASINSKLAPAVAEGLLTSTSCQVAPWSSERCNLPAPADQLDLRGRIQGRKGGHRLRGDRGGCGRGLASLNLCLGGNMLQSLL